MTNLLECPGCGTLNHPEDKWICGTCGAPLTEDMEISDGLQREIDREEMVEEFQKEQAYEMHRRGSVF